MTQTVALVVTLRIQEALQSLPESDRAGFLFALCIGDMLRAEWSKEMILAELTSALDVAWEQRFLAIAGPPTGEG